MSPAANIEYFPALGSLRGFVHGFTVRIPGIEVEVDRETALQRLDTVHADVRRELGVANRVFVTGRQVHGKEVAIVDRTNHDCVPGVDGLITTDPQVCLGIYVADCCALYLADERRQVVALLHAGRMGTELGIAPAAVARMQSEFGCAPKDLVAQLSPCIRPPYFEIDFAAQLVAQLREAGLEDIHNSGVCTASHPERYYSYRRELGKTGRMLALFAVP